MNKLINQPYKRHYFKPSLIGFLNKPQLSYQESPWINFDKFF